MKVFYRIDGTHLVYIEFSDHAAGQLFDQAFVAYPPFIRWCVPEEDLSYTTSIGNVWCEDSIGLADNEHIKFMQKIIEQLGIVAFLTKGKSPKSKLSDWIEACLDED